jgi:hypothetical protein
MRKHLPSRATGLAVGERAVMLEKEVEARRRMADTDSFITTPRGAEETMLNSSWIILINKI